MAERTSFFESLFGEQGSDEYIQLRFIAPKQKGKPAKEPGITRFAKSVVELEQILESEQELVSKRNTYFGPALLHSAAGEKENYSRCRTLWVDLDSEKLGGRSGALSASQALALPPSIIVDSGHGYHAYWLLDRWLSLEDLERAEAAIIRATESENVGDATRVLRVPGTFNQKWVDEGVLPVSIVRARYDLVYSLQDIYAASYIEPREKKLILTASSSGFKSRSERDWAVIVALKRLGMSDNGIRAVFKEQPIGDKFRDDGESYLNTTFENADEAIAKREELGVDSGQMFQELDGKYYVLDGNESHQVSTFVISPKRLYVSDDHREDAFICDITSQDQVWQDIVLHKSCFNRLSDFASALTSVYWQWLGSDREVRFLLPYLVKKWEAKGYSTAKMTESIGRFGDYWVYDGGVISQDNELDSLTAPIVYIASGRIAPPVTYRTKIDEQTFRRIVQIVGSNLEKINQPTVIWPIIGWFFAAPFKPILNEAGIRFPILNLYGSKGSGKTSTLLKAMLPIAGYVRPYSQDCSTTHFVLMSYMSSTNAVPIYLTEFRRSTLSEREYSSLKRILLQAYDVGQDARGRQNQTTQTYQLSAPLILDGEDAIQDAAIMERSVIVTMDPITIIEGTQAYACFNELTDCEDLYLMAGKYVQSTLAWTAADAEAAWRECFSEIGEVFPAGVPDRIKRNLVTVWFGIKRYVEFMSNNGYPIELPDIGLLVVALQNLVNVKMGRTTMAVDEFVTDIVCEIAMDRAVRPFLFRFDEGQKTLWFHLTTAYNWWARKRRTEGQPSMTLPAIKSQLRERDETIENSPGQYITGPKAVHYEGSTKWMYGILMERCIECDLDIPSDVAIRFVSLRLPDKKEETHVDVRDMLNS